MTAAGAGEFRADINGLRGLAVLLVVAYHVQWRGAGGGFIGVDVFFVVSGYLMTGILLRAPTVSPQSYLAFLAARARRIWPALAVLVLVLLAFGAAALPPFDLDTLARQTLWTLSFLSNHYFLAHSGYADRTADDLWLLHTWSLSVEWQFYLLYPLFIFAFLSLSRSSARSAARGLAPALLLLAAVSLGWQMALRGRPLESGFFLLAPRAWEFLAGGIVATIGGSAGGPAGLSRRALSVTGVLLIIGSAVALALLRQRAVGSDWVLLGPVLGTAAVLAARDATNPLLGSRGLQAIGRWSYSIYLWHWPMWVGWRLVLGPHEHRLVGGAVVVAASILLGALSYRWIEQPVLRWRRGDAGPRHGASLACAAALGTALLLAGAAMATGGWQQRDAGRLTDLAAYQASILPLLFPDDRCNNFRKPVEAMRPCSVERGTQRRVLVIGDSHAEHLWPWFVQHSRASVDFFGASECPPVPHFERLQPGYDCGRYAALAWEQARSARYDTVVVSARWATVALAGPPYCHRAPGKHCELAAAPAKPVLVIGELRAVIEATLAAGKTVVFLDSAPEAPVRVAKRQARERFWHGEPRLSIDRATLREATAWLDPLLDELSARPGFHRVSLRSVLCSAQRCRVYDDTLGRPIYTDESHFDPVWIAENAGFFEPFVQREPPARTHQP
jgi:peptidoglycan/LPS O-acetylase OafA/YrhL